MKKKRERKTPHNIGTHEERMAARKFLRKTRVRNVPYPVMSKFIPLVEDAKHLEEERLKHAVSLL